MKALVTGASGFVGRYLCDHLLSAGDQVVPTDRATGGADILDADAMRRLVAEHSPEAIYHLAGQADVAASWQAPVATLRSNAEGTQNVLAAAAEAGVAAVLAVTSAEVYGLTTKEQQPIDETMPLNPASPYAASKAAAEMVCVQWANSGLHVIRARAFNHLGPGQSERFVAAALAGRVVRAQQAGQSSISVGNLEARRDFTDVRDVVRAYRLLVTNGIPGEAYNVCSGSDVAIAELVNLVVQRSGHAVTLVPDPNLQRPSDLPVLRGDPTKLMDATGWKPEIALATTVDDLIAFSRAASES